MTLQIGKVLIEKRINYQGWRSGPKSGRSEAGGRDEGEGGGGVLDKEYQSAPVNCKADRLSAFCASRAKMSAIRTRHNKKKRYLSRKATMGIFGLYERSHIKRY